jgi:hypothetical protein
VWYPPPLTSVLPNLLRLKRIRPDRGNTGEKPKENIIQGVENKKDLELSTPVEKHVGNYSAFSPHSDRKMNVIPILSRP